MIRNLNIHYWGIEPSSNEFKCLNLNTCLDKNFKLFNNALSNFDGISKIYINSAHADSSLELFDSASFVEEIKVTTLDNIFTMEKFFYFKLEAEGHECEIIEGGQNSLINCKYIFADVSFEKFNNTVSTLPCLLNSNIIKDLFLIYDFMVAGRIILLLKQVSRK